MCNLLVDGVTGTDVVLVDKSALSIVGRLVVERIEWSLDGLSVLLEFDHDTDDKIVEIAGQGFMDLTNDGIHQGFVDPGSSGGTGNITLTSSGDTVGDSGSIILFLRKKY